MVHDRGPNPGSARDQEIERDAAADVAEVEQDDKYFAPDTPADEDELLSPVSHRLGNPADLGTGLRQLRAERRRDGCRGHGYGDDQFVNNLGETRRERRFSGDAIDPPLRLAASAWIWRDPLQQTTRPD